MAENWLTVVEAAQRFKLGKMAVYRRIWNGTLPATNIGDPDADKPEYRIAESDIDSYFESRRIKKPAVRTRAELAQV